MEGTNQDKKIYELLKKLADLECNHAKVEAITFAKKGSLLVAGKANDMANCIAENAREYGKKIEFVNETGKIKSAIEANIIRNYVLSLENVNKQFDIKYKMILEQKMRLQNKEVETEMIQNYIARKRDEAKELPEYAREKELQVQAKFAIDDGDYERLENINKELKDISKINKATKYEVQAKHLRAERARIEEAINKCEEELKNCLVERKQAIELIAGKKENLLKTADQKYLLVLQNTNWIQKTWGKILNKLNGNKRYTENVTNVLSKKVRDINYKSIPALKEKLQKETSQIIDKTNEVAQSITMEPVKTNDSKLIKGAKYTIKGINKVSDETRFVLKKGKDKMRKGSKKAQKTSKILWNSAKQTYSSTIEKYRSARMWTINRLEQRIAKLENEKEKRKVEKAAEQR